jgi:hypothetical protein
VVLTTALVGELDLHGSSPVIIRGLTLKFAGPFVSRGCCGGLVEEAIRLTVDQKQSAVVIVECAQALVDGHEFAVTMNSEAAANTSELLFHASIDAKRCRIVGWCDLAQLESAQEPRIISALQLAATEDRVSGHTLVSI